jgi:hypothetical protein
LVAESLLEFSDDDKDRIKWMITGRGRAYVEKLLSIPLPHLVEVWEFPDHVAG